MRKIFIATLIGFLLFVSGCVYFGLGIKESISLNDFLEIQKLLNEVEYPQEYEFGVFDCSNATALLYDYFTKKGFKCEIMIGWQPPWSWHTWLIVKKNGKEFWIESTSKSIKYPCCYEEYLVKFRSRSLKFLQFFSGIIFMPNEWDY